VRRLTILGVTLLLVLALTPALTVASVKHGCAPVVPPTVSGQLVQPTATRGILFINEALLVPHSTWNCSELGTYSPANDSWIEIYNAQNQPFDLYSVHTSIDGGPNTNPFYLPFGSAIAPYGFLVVFPRIDANFSSTETATWRLLIGSVVVDEVTIPALGEDQAYAREPDGSPNWIIASAPTIDASNISSVMPPTATITKAEARATARAEKSNGVNNGSGSDKGAGGGSYGNGNGSGGGSYGNGNGSGKANGQQVDGTQPSWTSLHHVGTASTTPVVTQQGNNPIMQVSDGALDIPHKILLTLLVVALAVALFWCWRLFRAT